MSTFHSSQISLLEANANCDYEKVLLDNLKHQQSILERLDIPGKADKNETIAKKTPKYETTVSSRSITPRQSMRLNPSKCDVDVDVNVNGPSASEDMSKSRGWLFKIYLHTYLPRKHTSMQYLNYSVTESGINGYVHFRSRLSNPAKYFNQNGSNFQCERVKYDNIDPPKVGSFTFGIKPMTSIEKGKKERERWEDASTAVTER